MPTPMSPPQRRPDSLFFVYYALELGQNREFYWESAKFQWKRFGSNFLKFGKTLAIPCGLYVLARPEVMQFLQEPGGMEAISSLLPTWDGFSPTASSIMADGVCCSVYLPLSALIARHTGLARASPPLLEDRIKGSWSSPGKS